MSPPSRAPSTTTATAPSPAEAAEIAHARRLGRDEGERFDGELREREQAEIAARRDLARGETGSDRALASSEASRLRRQVEDLAAFHHAVQRSRGWRLLQLLRRPFGRAW